MLIEVDETVKILKYCQEQKYTLKVMLASVLAFTVGLLLQYPYHEIMWVVITVFVAMDARADSTWVLSITRVLGTALGVIVAAGLLQILKPAHPLAMYLCLMIVAVVAGQINLFGKGVRVAGVAAAIVLFMGDPGAAAWHLGWDRFIDISLGVLCALLISMLVFPDRAQESVAKNTLKLLQLTQTLYRLVLQPINSDTALHSELQSMKALLDKNHNLAQEIKLEYGRRMISVTLLLYIVDSLEEIYVQFQSMEYAVIRAEHLKAQQALAPELAELQQVADNLCQHMMQMLAKQDWQLDRIHYLQKEAERVLKQLDVKFMNLRIAREFSAYNETEILAGYTYLYHVKGLVDKLSITVMHLYKLGKIYQKH